MVDRRLAKREAWWIAAGLVRSALADGYDLGLRYPDDPVAVERVSAALAVVIEEMERKGRLPSPPSAGGPY